MENNIEEIDKEWEKQRKEDFVRQKEALDMEFQQFAYKKIFRINGLTNLRFSIEPHDHLKTGWPGDEEDFYRIGCTMSVYCPVDIEDHNDTGLHNNFLLKLFFSMMGLYKYNPDTLIESFEDKKFNNGEYVLVPSNRYGIGKTAYKKIAEFPILLNDRECEWIVGAEECIVVKSDDDYAEVGTWVRR